MPAPVSRAAAASLARSAAPPPFQLQPEYAVDEIVNLSQIPREEIDQLRPPVPQQLFPPRLGYASNQPTIADVLQTDRWAPQFRSWTSGGSAPIPPVQYNGLDGAQPGVGKNSLTGLAYETG